MSSIPADVRRFLLTAMASVPHLEALLLLHADAARAWTVEQLARRLYVDEAVAAAVLADLRSHRLAKQGPLDDWAFDVSDVALAEMVARVEQVYARNVVEVAELIHSTSDRKAQRFADAFHWRKEN